eukprot:gene17754-24114_t
MCTAFQAWCGLPSLASSLCIRLKSNSEEPCVPAPFGTPFCSQLTNLFSKADADIGSDESVLRDRESMQGNAIETLLRFNAWAERMQRIIILSCGTSEHANLNKALAPRVDVATLQECGLSAMALKKAHSTSISAGLPPVPGKRRALKRPRSVHLPKDNCYASTRDGPSSTSSDQSCYAACVGFEAASPADDNISISYQTDKLVRSAHAQNSIQWGLHSTSSLSRVDSNTLNNSNLAAGYTAATTTTTANTPFTTSSSQDLDERGSSYKTLAGHSLPRSLSARRGRFPQSLSVHVTPTAAAVPPKAPSSLPNHLPSSKLHSGGHEQGEVRLLPGEPTGTNQAKPTEQGPGALGRSQSLSQSQLSNSSVAMNNYHQLQHPPTSKACACPESCGWFSKCRGCAQLTGRTYATAGGDVPFCGCCTQHLSGMQEGDKQRFEKQLQVIHEGWLKCSM